MICASCGAANPDDGVACTECGVATQPLPPMGPGFVLAGRYEILRILGRGGMGVVYQAKDRLLEETVAIKVLRAEAAASPEIAQRFRAEIKLARAVSHKNVCRIHEYGEDRGIRYISMAFVDGVDLKQVLRQQGPLPPREAFDVLVRSAEALQAIHDEGIIHRDLKTPNIMLDGKGVVRLMDFGIAKQEQGDGLSMTVTGQVIGTPEYMSPEQVQAQRIDFRSDLYSLGIVAYELFTGVTPFRADTPLGTALKHLNEPPPLEGPQAALLPRAVVPVLRKALAKRRDDRYATAREMGEALTAARAATPAATDRIQSAPTAATAGETLLPTQQLTTTLGADPEATRAIAPQPEPRPRSPWIGAGLAATVLLAVGVAALALRSLSRTSAERPPAPSPQAASAATLAPLPMPSAAAADAAPRVPEPAASTPPRERARAPSAGRVEASPPSTLPTPPAAGVPVDAEAAAQAARVEKLLADADGALEAQSFEVAIARYDEVLRLDPRSSLARMGRATAVSARAVRAATPPPPAKPSFVPGRTVAESAETRPDKALSAGFEDSPGVAVTRDTQPALLPGRIDFRTDPATVGPGDRYKLEIRFVNNGAAPILIQGMLVTTTVNERKASGAVPPAVSTVAPGQGAALLSLSDTLRADARSWSLEVVVHTSRGEIYRNRLVWTP